MKPPDEIIAEVESKYVNYSCFYSAQRVSAHFEVLSGGLGRKSQKPAGYRATARENKSSELWRCKVSRENLTDVRRPDRVCE